ncbi:MAG TPA: sulfatase, partial [Tepidisphaeraceae bacterium]|nr:sulfatase [Tepidisphaeraceae bacterium]
MTPRILLVVLALLPALAQAQPARPNVLWIVSEDNTYATIGAYGMDANAVTPTIDGLAKQGVLYRHCFSQAPVCAPSRFTIITGVYATSAGPAHQMRARGNITPAIRGFSAYLREAGYYCTNNAKTDYNAPIDMKDAWDESSKKAHWRNRKPGQPFFAVFNHETTHESSVFGKMQPLAGGTDPAKVNLPPYTPDTPETRADRALYHDNIRRMDNQVANLLKQLADDGLAEDTIVFYYGDNGGVLPRSKRFCYDSGLRVPLIVKFPKKWQHLAPAEAGGQIAAPVSFVDFAPTVLSLCGVEAPKHFEGKALMGPKKGPDSQYAFSFRARMDERYDLVRTVRSDRYRYTINYAPHVPYGARNQYQFQQKGYRAWKALFEAGKLEGIQKAFWMEKPAEELYDVQADPHEVNNLAVNSTPEVAARMKEMREAIRQHMIRTRDNGLIPEGAPAEGYAAAKDAGAYPVEAVIAAADLAIERDPKNLPKL